MPNFDLRTDALACFHQAVAAVEPSRLVRDDLLQLGSLSAPKRVKLVAVGKAAVAMARGAVEALPGRVDQGVVITLATAGADLPCMFEIHEGGHPIPNEEGLRGAEAIRLLAEDLGRDDILLCLISGGGSALMTLPSEGLCLADLQQTTDHLLRAGATIGELNSVRKHLDQLKGGRLAAAAFPARVEALVLSDVVGDALDVIASGPVTPDPTTFEEALGVLQRRGILTAVPRAVRDHLERGVRGELAESPKVDDPCFENTRTRIVGNNRLAVHAAVEEARRRGYEPMALSTVVTGEAREVGQMLAALGQDLRRGAGPISPPACLLLAGETTVTVRGAGRGGRNQEVALGAALALHEIEQSALERNVRKGNSVLIASLGTDGIDGPTDAAGAMAWHDTVERARGLDLDAPRALADNDAYPFFEALGDLVRTGPTGTNVMDLMLVLVS